MKKDTRKVWLVPHPTSQFKEDVKDLARRNNLQIVDAKFKDDIDPKAVEAKPPELTPVKKPEKAKA